MVRADVSAQLELATAKHLTGSGDEGESPFGPVVITRTAAPSATTSSTVTTRANNLTTRVAWGSVRAGRTAVEMADVRCPTFVKGLPALT